MNDREMAEKLREARNLITDSELTPLEVRVRMEKMRIDMLLETIEYQSLTIKAMQDRMEMLEIRIRQLTSMVQMMVNPFLS